MADYFEQKAQETKKEDTPTGDAAVAAVVKVIEFFGLSVGLGKAELESWEKIQAAVASIGEAVAKLGDNAERAAMALKVFQASWLRGTHKYLSVFQSDYASELADVFGVSKALVLSWKDGEAQGFIPEILEPAGIFLLRSYGFGQKTARLVELVPLCKATEKAKAPFGMLDTDSLKADAKIEAARLLAKYKK